MKLDKDKDYLIINKNILKTKDFAVNLKNVDCIKIQNDDIRISVIDSFCFAYRVKSTEERNNLFNKIVNAWEEITILKN